jgi:RNA polymerase sigma-70 factor (ECF subfamily)
VSESNARNHKREQFASEALTHLDHLYRVAFHLVRNQDEAQDCVQETCARALSSYGQFTPGSNMKAWLTKILYNLFFDSYARNKRTVAADDLVQGTDAGDFWETHAADQPGPEKQFLQQELGAKIAGALKQIPEEFRAPILLVDMSDFSYAEAAEVLSCPIGTVRSRLSRGRRLLQKHLSGYLGKTGTDR